MHGGPQITREPLFDLRDLRDRLLGWDCKGFMDERYLRVQRVGYECWWFQKRKPVSVIRGLT